MPRGAKISACVAGPPSPEKPGSPVPATVVIVPSDAIERIRWLSASATSSAPLEVNATP